MPHGDSLSRATDSAYGIGRRIYFVCGMTSANPAMATVVSKRPPDAFGKGGEGE